MPFIYTVFSGGDEDKLAFKSKEQAVKRARELAADSDIDIDVTRCELPPLTLDLVIAIIDNQGGGFALSQDVVATVKPRRKKETA